MQAAGIGAKVYGPHSIRSASSTKAAELGNEVDKIKKYANWSLSANTFERFYYKSPHQHADSKKITDSIFSFCPENHTTSKARMKSTRIGLDTSSNWYRGYCMYKVSCKMQSFRST